MACFSGKILRFDKKSTTEKKSVCLFHFHFYDKQDLPLRKFTDISLGKAKYARYVI
jgi:hypothetical protein